MRGWTAEKIAQASGARLIAPPPTDEGPEHVVIDSRQVAPGALFVGLPGSNTHGGRHAPQALAEGAWGILTTPEYAQAAQCASPGVLLASDDPLRSLQKLAKAWRKHLRASVIGVTGSTGKTSTKDLLNAIVAPHTRTTASRANFNTEIGLPLEILSAPEGTEILILEMAMRGAGQIAELAEIAEPDVAVVVSIGPVHLELMGTIEAIAAAKAELIAALKAGGTAVIPADERLLEPYRRSDITEITFGEGGDVRLLQATESSVQIQASADTVLTLDVDFTEAHLRRNLLAATAAALAVGVVPRGQILLTRSPGRGQKLALQSGVTLIDDSYNANPMSMRAALDELAATAGRNGTQHRTVAVLGDMLELGAEHERGFHEQIGSHARQAEVDLLVTVGPRALSMADGFTGGESHSVADADEAAALLPELVQPGDVVLVKASRAVGLERVCEALKAQP